MYRLFRNTIVLISMCLVSLNASALSLALDSIATWGKFPKFCIDTYRWGDGFFNGYDTVYVKGSGHKFNVKLTMDSWIDTYNFYLPDKVQMAMRSEPSTSMGAYLTYLAVSAGYSKNISRFFGKPDYKNRIEYTFGFNCSLFAFNMYFIDNSTGVKITRFGAPGNTIRPDVEFNGLKSKSFGFDTYYFFNHKKYSQAAAFSFSRVQTKSHGSPYAGISYCTQNYNFDFAELPPYMRNALPDNWKENGYKYTANTKNLAVKLGYGYNWVFAPHWLFAISESPTLGLKIGTVNSDLKKSTRATFNNHLRASVVWNNGNWFAGAIGEFNTALIYDKKTVFQNSMLTGTIQVGYRFDLW